MQMGIGDEVFDEFALIAVRIAASLAVGAAIGFERGFHGRPAGFRTHALVCLASALLMLVTVFQSTWMTELSTDAIRTDPTRMAQGIMTGIGFLGAGVIFREGNTVRGLTTAATIWITSAIGILIGIGFYVPAAMGAVATLIVLSGLRHIEVRLPRRFHAQLAVRFRRENALSEGDLRALLAERGFSTVSMEHRLTDGGLLFEYRTTISGGGAKSVKGTGELSTKLREMPEVIEFKIMPTGD